MQPSNVGLVSARVPTCAFHFRKCLGAKTTHWGLTRDTDGTFQQESANCVETDFVCLFDLKLDYLIRPCALHLCCDLNSTRNADADLKKKTQLCFLRARAKALKSSLYTIAVYNVIMTELANFCLQPTPLLLHHFGIQKDCVTPLLSCSRLSSQL